MPYYAAECYNSGLFSIVAVVLNEHAPGYQNFKNQAVESWKKLGVDEDAIKNVILKKQSAEETRGAMREDLPILVEKGYGEKGRSFYTVGFWYGTVLLGAMSNLTKEMEDWIRSLKYKCAEIGNPKLLVDFVKDSEDKLERGESIDIVKMGKIAEELYLWIVANGNVEKQKNMMDVIITSSSEGLPYVGKLIRAVYERIRE